MPVSTPFELTEMSMMVWHAAGVRVVCLNAGDVGHLVRVRIEVPTRPMRGAWMNARLTCLAPDRWHNGHRLVRRSQRAQAGG
jgi:hypothetical protein